MQTNGQLDCVLEKPNGRPPFRPWRNLNVGEFVTMETEDAAKAGLVWAKRHGRVFTREKQGDGTGWMVKRIA